MKNVWNHLIILSVFRPLFSKLIIVGFIVEQFNFRDDLALMYFLSVDPSSGKLLSLHMTPVQTKHFKANRASRVDALWLRDILNREGKNLGTRAEINQEIR